MHLRRRWALTPPREAFDDLELMRRCSPGCRAARAVAPGHAVLELQVPLLRGQVLEVDLRQRWLDADRLQVEAFSQSALGTVRAQGVWSWTGEGLEVEGQASLGGTLASVGQRVLEPLARAWLDEFVRLLDVG